MPYHELLNDMSTAPISVLQVPYGYEQKMDDILDFFDEYLRN
ncbi:MAG: hypothetical protein P9M14_06580 [Candidatus Alcyoniella australis]|nr:hypothetical protein [Candidatus Alcyoniella australis]